MEDEALNMAKKMKKKKKAQGTLVLGELRDYTEASEEQQMLIPSPATGEAGSLTPPR
eukprot:CAMPEP_0119086702 /NCGR_PEP_ID=MMETSP1178-20130426/139061_1 /TAXON_ID=33656 /ORGANISM="unid sp, Strain CCMP2000" /LENGTH=56 /DNA_ID=CAMNT_0007069853 /DNA_START=44 /DNA_END=210 /DNA_ORIENTATION=+